MSAASFDRLLKSSRLAVPAIGADDFRADRSIRIARLDRDRLEGKTGGGQSGGGGADRMSSLSRRADARAAQPLRSDVGSESDRTMNFDRRQRAIVKAHYFNHAAGGGGALKAHVRYVARDAASRDTLPDGSFSPAERAPEAAARAHTDYLARVEKAEEGARGMLFYDALSDAVDGATRAESWARTDRRHFRVILSAELGDRIHDLPGYTREVMARAEVALGAKLQWIAVDHHDTDNPHTHLIVRGRRADGRDLVLPRDFVRYGFAGIAREVATEWLGVRSPADERRALEREARRHGPTRLDRLIAAQLNNSGEVRLAALAAPNSDPETTRAMKARAQELTRMGLAREVKRNMLTFSPDWRERLAAMELHIDIRKRVLRDRAAERRAAQDRALRRLGRGLPDR